MNNPMECPYCLCAIGTEQGTVKCDSCGEVYHSECWDHNGGCCAVGCAEVVRHLEVDAESQQGDILVLSRESVQSAIAHKPEREWNPCLRCGRHVPEGELYCGNCTPEPEGSQDAKNTGPILITLLLIALAVFWLIYLTTGPDESQQAPPPVQQGDTRR